MYPLSPTTGNTNGDLSSAIDKHGPILGHYVNIARVLGEMFKPVLETVVHDLRYPSRTIIAIYNGHLTGRKVGDPATDVVQQLVEGNLPDVVVGYANRSPNGQELKSSSVAIRDEDGELIGVMGLNFDISYFAQYNKFIEQIISTHTSEYVRQAERFRKMAPRVVGTPHDEIRDAINQFIISNNWNTRILSNNEKRTIVEYLYENGYFKTRSAVTIIAQELGLTRTSVYNYKNDYIEEMEESL